MKKKNQKKERKSEGDRGRKRSREGRNEVSEYGFFAEARNHARRRKFSAHRENEVDETSNDDVDADVYLYSLLGIAIEGKQQRRRRGKGQRERKR